MIIPDFFEANSSPQYFFRLISLFRQDSLSALSYVRMQTPIVLWATEWLDEYGHEHRLVGRLAPRQQWRGVFVFLKTRVGSCRWHWRS